MPEAPPAPQRPRIAAKLILQASEPPEYIHAMGTATDSPLPPAAPAATPRPSTTALMDSYQALRHGCGLADRSSAGRLELLGADRQRFLNAYVTCDVKGLAAGQGEIGRAHV